MTVVPPSPSLGSGSGASGASGSAGVSGASGSSGRPRRLVGVASVVGVVAVAAVGWWAYERTTEPDLCEALSADVDEADGFLWDNGVTESGPQWAVVLTSGVDEIAAIEQPELADRVAADESGYAAVRRALPMRSRAVADRQRARVIDHQPSAVRRADPEARADVAHLARLAVDRCDLI